jgi:hypothetical protein
MRGVFVRPFDRPCFAIVGADVAHDFAVEIFDRTEDAAGDEVALDFGKPDFDLVEPGGVGGRVMNPHFGMTSQKITGCLGLMRAQVITDDMHRLLLGLACDEIFQKRDELCTGVTGASLANDLAAGVMERRVQGPKVAKARNFGQLRQPAHWAALEVPEAFYSPGPAR